MLWSRQSNSFTFTKRLIVETEIFFVFLLTQSFRLAHTFIEKRPVVLMISENMLVLPLSTLTMPLDSIHERAPLEIIRRSSKNWIKKRKKGNKTQRHIEAGQKMEEDLGASEHVIETLRNRGWCFRGLEQVKAIIIINTALADDDTPTIVASVESELANMDIRTIGGKSLPDPSIIRKSSHLSGPKVLQAVTSFSYLYLYSLSLCLVLKKNARKPITWILRCSIWVCKLRWFRGLCYLFIYLFWQISSARDISKSSLEDFSNSSGSRRLLRLGLTDGFTEITAIEYSNIPSISDDIVPGTKVISRCIKVTQLSSLT